MTPIYDYMSAPRCSEGAPAGSCYIPIDVFLAMADKEWQFMTDGQSKLDENDPWWSEFGSRTQGKLNLSPDNL
jgi:hypothetical protein